MAYMSQTKKQQILAALKGIIPAGWKWSLAVSGAHSTLVLNIRSAPVDLLGEINRVLRAAGRFTEGTGADWVVNEYFLASQFDQTLPLMQKILAAMNDGNHDRSDSQTDYFDVGWYVKVSIGRWDRPFVCTATEPTTVAAAITAACAARGLSADRLVVAVVR